MFSQLFYGYALPLELLSKAEASLLQAKRVAVGPRAQLQAACAHYLVQDGGFQDHCISSDYHQHTSFGRGEMNASDPTIEL